MHSGELRGNIGWSGALFSGKAQDATKRFINAKTWTVFDFFRRVDRQNEAIGMNLATGNGLLYNNTIGISKFIIVKDS